MEQGHLPHVTCLVLIGSFSAACGFALGCGAHIDDHAQGDMGAPAKSCFDAAGTNPSTHFRTITNTLCRRNAGQSLA